MVRPPSDFVKSKFDDTEEIVESILSDGVESVNTDSAEINSTLISATATVNNQTISSGTWATVDYPNGSEDSNNEFSSNLFTPTETGWYFVKFKAQMIAGSAGDTLLSRWQNVTDNVTVQLGDLMSAADGDDETVEFDELVELEAGKDYAPQVRDNQSSTGVRAGKRSNITIRSAFK